MTDPADYVYELAEWIDEVERIIRMDNNVPRAGAKNEARLVERFIRDVAWGQDRVAATKEKAMQLIRILDNPNRVRWYA